MNNIKYLVIFIAASTNLLKAQNNITIWKDNGLGQPMLISSIRSATDTFITTDILPVGLDSGGYILYWGKEDLRRYGFPEKVTEDEFYLYENQILIDRLNDTCYKQKDTLPDGKWLKIRVDKNGGAIVLVEKNVKYGLLDSDLIYSWKYMANSIDSRVHFKYKAGTVIFLERINRSNQLYLKGTYDECARIIEEKVWENGRLKYLLKSGSVYEYDQNGKLISTKKTDAWGNW